MQSESNHIDNFFRRKEAASIADNSNMNAHWKQMQEMMNIHPVSKAPKTISFNLFLKYAAVILLVAGAIFFVLQNNKTKKTIAIKHSNEKISPSSSDTDRHTSTNLLPEQEISTEVKSAALTRQTTGKNIPRNELPGSIKVESVSEKVLLPENKSLVVTKDEINHDNAGVFKKFYADIKKEPEYFKINTTRDTTVVCKEGTTVFIPANAFQTRNGEPISGPVTVAIKEFYSIADIISNNLTTSSNGKQLITGGMLNILAVANNQTLQIRQGSFIDLKMPTRVFNAGMQLFTGQENSIDVKTPGQKEASLKATANLQTKTLEIDTVIRDYTSTASSFFNQGINWIPAGQRQFFIDDKKKEITIFDLQDYSRVVWRKDKSIAKYLIPFDCPLSTDQMEVLLREKHGKWYDEIKVKRARKPWSKKRRVTYPTDWVHDGQFVGDSLVIPLRIAMRRKLISREDSIRYEMEFQKKYDEAVKRNDAYNDFVMKKNSYDFRITGLGWVNCDRFLNYPAGRLSEFYVKTPEGYEGTYFASMLLFENSRSAMAGSWDLNGRISFPKIPLGEEVSLICLGAKDGKMYASVQQFFVERDPNVILKLEEVSPEQFRDKLSRFGSVQNSN